MHFGDSSVHLLVHFWLLFEALREKRKSLNIQVGVCYFQIKYCHLITETFIFISRIRIDTCSYSKLLCTIFRDHSSPENQNGEPRPYTIPLRMKRSIWNTKSLSWTRWLSNPVCSNNSAPWSRTANSTILERFLDTSHIVPHVSGEKSSRYLKGSRSKERNGG